MARTRKDVRGLSDSSGPRGGADSSVVSVPCQGPFPMETAKPHLFPEFPRPTVRLGLDRIIPRDSPPASDLISESDGLDREDCAVGNEQAEPPA